MSAELRPSEAPGPPDLATDDDLELLVRRFYASARADGVLGPVFAAAELDWDAHVDRVTAFWSWQLLGGRRYEGRPLRSHRRVHDEVPFTEAHYQRWLELFDATVRASWSGPVADLAVERAERMARSMRRVLTGSPDPDPIWAEEEGASPPSLPPSEGAGVTMRVALGPRSPRRTDPPDAR